MGTGRSAIREPGSGRDRRSVNRSMFWRVLRRSVFADRGRLLVILSALGAGAAVTAALLNLQVDARRRLNTEFRAFGANILMTPRGENSPESAPSTLAASFSEKIPKKNGSDLVAKAVVLYGTATAAADDKNALTPGRQKGSLVVVAGYEFYGKDFSDIFPSSVVAGEGGTPRQPEILAPQETSSAGARIPRTESGPAWTRMPGPASCELGEELAVRLGAQVGQDVDVWKDSLGLSCNVRSIRRFGGPEDFQLFVGLYHAQKLFGQSDQASLIALNVPGNPDEISRYVAELQAAVPALAVRPVRQFTEGGARLYDKISGILTATVAVVLVLTALCVMAAMTNIAAERKNDVGLMKAIGGSVRRVLRIFLAEAALLGLVAGLLGAAAGIVLSIGLGKAVFGVAAQPRLIVYPISVALTVIVAILAAYPLRRLAQIRPASVFRGDE